eukprot:scaffold245022_cov32-Tisochrysis_lutea.AAC.6
MCKVVAVSRSFALAPIVSRFAFALRPKVNRALRSFTSIILFFGCLPLSMPAWATLALSSVAADPSAVASQILDGPAASFPRDSPLSCLGRASEVSPSGWTVAYTLAVRPSAFARLLPTLQVQRCGRNTRSSFVLVLVQWWYSSASSRRSPWFGSHGYDATVLESSHGRGYRASGSSGTNAQMFHICAATCGNEKGEEHPARTTCRIKKQDASELQLMQSSHTYT